MTRRSDSVRHTLTTAETLILWRWHRARVQLTPEGEAARRTDPAADLPEEPEGGSEQGAPDPLPPAA